MGEGGKIRMMESGVRRMARELRKEAGHEEYEEGMKDTFIAVFFIAGFIILSWVAIFAIYLSRL